MQQTPQKFRATGNSGRRRPFVDSMSSIFFGSLHGQVRTLRDMTPEERRAIEQRYGMPIAADAA